MSSSVRTCGDGTENPEVLEISKTTQRKQSSSQNEEEINLLGKRYLSKQMKSSSQILLVNPSSTTSAENFPLPVEPNGKRFYLIPKLVSKPQSVLTKNRKLNLVLMEPYKACVNPIIPSPHHSVKKIKQSRNNLQMTELMKHLKMNTEMSERNSVISESDDLKTQRDNLDKQLKFQIQVNAELKGLLVHCLGEDLQAKVNNLTEDKMKIANSLSSNTEKVEYLSSQTEVWRSKFLASSLMVEELAKVKTALTQKNTNLTSSNKQLLETIERVRFGLTEIYQNLKFLSNSNENNLKSFNVIDLTTECLSLSQKIALNSGIIGLPATSFSNNMTTSTDAETFAMKALSETNETPIIDEAFKAICNQAQQEYKRDQVHSDHDDVVSNKSQ